LRGLSAAAAAALLALCGCGPAKEGSPLPYGDFTARNAAHSAPRTPAGFEKDLGLAADFLKKNPGGRHAPELKEKIIGELNIGFLLDGLDDRELKARTVYSRRRKGYTEKKVLLADPQVGELPVLVLVPERRQGNSPAVIGLHGHGDSPERFRDGFHGKELARAGFVVALPSFRAMDYPAVERAVSENLYYSGFTLMGLRVYEALLVIKYLKGEGAVAAGNIGIMGHSGGASAAILVSRLSRDLRAGVYDMKFPPLDTFDKDLKSMHCETVPRLAYYGPQINDLATMPFAAREFEYGYPSPEDRQELIGFFKENLAAPGPDAPGRRLASLGLLRRLAEKGAGRGGETAAGKGSPAVLNGRPAGSSPGPDDEKKKSSRKLSGLAVEKMRAGDRAGAEKLLLEARALDPGNIEALMDLCSLWAAGKMKERALQACRAASAAVYSNRANRTQGLLLLASDASFSTYLVLSSMGRQAEARKELAAAVENAPAGWPGLAEARRALAER